MPLLGRSLSTLLVFSLTVVAGFCASAQSPVPNDLLKNPFGTASGKTGYNAPNMTVSSALDQLEQLSGKHFIRDANLFGVPGVSITIEGLTKEDSIRLITATLLLNGVAIIPVDDHTMKAVTVGTNKNPRSEGMRVYTNVADLPTDDEIVTYYMALDHIDPQEAAGIFTQVAPVHVYGAYVPAPSAQGVILTENASVIRELIELKKNIDVAKEPNVRPPPPEPRGPADSRPPRPPQEHPLAKLIGFLFLSAFFVFLVAAGNVVAHRWVNRGKRTTP